ncbi:hypothetical protein Syun_017305 [Stephania yunnanensis]|uniref:Uncharacterized protein n=1 Tax=Stephania yunnanensis TaxID=152371 RepID=A0AAP0J8Y1_9MAGN
MHAKVHPQACSLFGARRRRQLLLHRFGSHFSHWLDGAKQFLGNAPLSYFPRPRCHRHHSSFASLSSHHQHHRPNHAFDLALTPNFVANTVSGTSVYTVSNSNNEFVLVSNPNSLKSLGLLCFLHEDVDTLLAQEMCFSPRGGMGIVEGKALEHALGNHAKHAGLMRQRTSMDEVTPRHGAWEQMSSIPKMESLAS